MTDEQLARALEFQADFCALTSEEIDGSNFFSWFKAYAKYVEFGPDDVQHGGQRPGHKPPI